MKRNIILYCLAGFTAFAALSSCDDNDDKRPAQPGFIETSLPTTLTVEEGETFELYVPADENVDSYIWTLPSSLEIISGQGTHTITVKVLEGSAAIASGTISVVAVDSSGNESIPRVYWFDITVTLPAPTIRYKTKRYGGKTWMTENLRESGEDGTLGRVYNDDPTLEEMHGRLYSWHEAMTGIPGATADDHPYNWGYSGLDDAGNAFSLDGSVENSYNIQLQGICPDGYHISNMYDWYDLVAAIKDDYNIPGNTLAEVGSLMAGFITPPTAKKTAAYASTSMNLTDVGFVGAYLKGGSPGVGWQNLEYFSYGGNANFPSSTEYRIFMDESVRNDIGFNMYGSGQMKNGSFVQMGVYCYYMVASFPAQSQVHRRTVGPNANLSVGNENVDDRLSIRCVANYN